MEKFAFDQQIARMAEKNLLYSPEKDLRRSHIVKTIYDPACGTGGMLSVAERYIRDLNAGADPHLFGQDWNDEAWAVCKSDMLIKGEDADNIRLGDTFSQDAFDREPDGKRITFDYMLANPIDKFELGIRKLIADLMIERMAENDKLVTRYMEDRDFQGSAFPILAKEIFETVRAAAASS